MFAEKLIQVQMFEQYVTMKEDKRRKFEGRDGFDTGNFSKVDSDWSSSSMSEPMSERDGKSKKLFLIYQN